MKNTKLTLTLLLAGLFTAGLTFSQDAQQPHVPFSELDPSKGYANEAEYIKAYQKMNARAKSSIADKNVNQADEQKQNTKMQKVENNSDPGKIKETYVFPVETKEKLKSENKRIIMDDTIEKSESVSPKK